MTNKLKNAIWVEKYRPLKFDDLIFSGKQELQKFLLNPKQIPSFIFYSSSPGTGKTSTAQLIAKELDCDFKKINASDERGIDVIREQVKNFATSVSFDGNKRCIFLDEADGLTKQAQESMKVIMEECSKNCFFIFSCNDISKIEDPIKSRCVSFNFENPDKKLILPLLMDISIVEDLKIKNEDLSKLVSQYYPDIRKMICELQRYSITGKLNFETGFSSDLKELKSKNVQYFYQGVYSGTLDMDGFIRFLFKKIWESYGNPSSTLDIHKLSKISFLIAEIEKSWEIKANKEIVFLTNILAIMELL